MGSEAPISPRWSFEQAYACFVVMVGVIVISFTVGAASSIIADMDSVAIRHKQELRTLEQYMHTRAVPHALRQRVLGFFEYVTVALKAMDKPEVIGFLPSPMQLHLNIVTNRRLFTDVALFKSCNPEVVAVCLHFMFQQISLPGEKILVEGERPRALFIIRSGHVRVSIRNPWAREEGSFDDFSVLYKTGGEKLAIDFYDNDIFGERSLITRKPVTATVTSMTYCDLLALKARDFYLLLRQFPELHPTILESAGKQDKRRNPSCVSQSGRIMLGRRTFLLTRRHLTVGRTSLSDGATNPSRQSSLIIRRDDPQPAADSQKSSPRGRGGSPDRQGSCRQARLYT